MILDQKNVDILFLFKLELQPPCALPPRQDKAEANGNKAIREPLRLYSTTP